MPARVISCIQSIKLSLLIPLLVVGSILLTVACVAAGIVISVSSDTARLSIERRVADARTAAALGISLLQAFGFVEATADDGQPRLIAYVIPPDLPGDAAKIIAGVTGGTGAVLRPSTPIDRLRAGGQQ